MKQTIDGGVLLFSGAMLAVSFAELTPWLQVVALTAGIFASVAVGLNNMTAWRRRDKKTPDVLGEKPY